MCLMDVIMVFQGSFKGISRLFLGCFKEVPRKFHGRLKDVSKKFPVCVESISRVFQGSCMGIKEVSCGYQERFNQGLLGACKYYMSTLGGGGLKEMLILLMWLGGAQWATT